MDELQPGAGTASDGETAEQRRLVMHLRAKTETGEEVALDISADVFVKICSILPTGQDGIQQAELIARFGAMLCKADLTEVNYAYVHHVFQMLYNFQDVEKWKTPLDPLLSACYLMLREQLVTRQGAADFASAQLGKPVDKEAWRKRVDRWAADPKRNLPQIGKRRQRNR